MIHNKFLFISKIQEKKPYNLDISGVLLSLYVFFVSLCVSASVNEKEICLFL
jgi:hypothetical protein